MFVLMEHGLERWLPGFGRWSGANGSLGTSGVVAFFLVSGFIIPVSIERQRSLTRFWLGRLFRLAPLYYASFVAYLLLVHFHFRYGLAPFDDSHSTRFVIGNLLMVQDFLHVKCALGNYWTLTYELVFYALCSILFYFKMSQKLLLWTWAVISIFFLVNLSSALLLHQTLSAGRMGLVALAFYGTLLQRHFSGGPIPDDLRILAVVYCVAFASIFWLHYSIYPVDIGERYMRSAFGSDVSWAGGVLLFLGFYRLRHKELPGALLWLGRISYSVYLVHDLVLVLLPGWLPLWLGMFLLVAATLAFSQLTYWSIERPMVMLQHRLMDSDRLQTRTLT
jgi:peptidoglycan/LPS O-acetylase OafA/YrhL